MPMSREELHRLVEGAARILRKGVTTRSGTDSLSTLEKALADRPVAEGRWNHLDEVEVKEIFTEGVVAGIGLGRSMYPPWVTTIKRLWTERIDALVAEGDAGGEVAVARVHTLNHCLNDVLKEATAERP